MGVSSVDTARSTLSRALDLSARGRHAAASQAFVAVITWFDSRPQGSGALDDDELFVLVRAMIGEAMCLFETKGEPRPSLALLDDAQGIAQAAGSTRLSAVVTGQRGLLRHRSGQLGHALQDMDRALATAPASAGRDLAILHMNRGSLHSDTGRLDEAAADYAASLEHARQIGNDLYASMAAHNLGWVEYLRGDLPGALRAMDGAARFGAGRHEAVGLIDRAQVLLEAGLLSEADKTLEQARAHLGRHRTVRDLAELQLVRSRCLVGLRRYREAVAQARSAERRFDRMGNVPGALRARCAELQALLAADRAVGLSPRAARRRAARALELVESGTAFGPLLGQNVVLPALLLAAEWLVAGEDLAGARSVLARLPRDLGVAPLPLRMQHQVVRAQLAFAAGDRATGLRAVRKGQRVLAEHRERLGSVDAVTASAVHGLHLNTVDVLAALRTERASALLDAVERGRATVAGGGRVRPPSDPHVADLLARARRELEAARLLGPSAVGQQLAKRRDHQQRARVLQEAARRRSWHEDGGAVTPTAVTARRLRRALTDAASSIVVADFVILDGALLVTRTDRSGVTMVRLASMQDVGERIRRTRADLDVLANGLIPPQMRSAARASLDRNLAWLDRHLLVPVDAPGDLHIATRDLLLAVPWSSLPSRVGRRTWVNSWIDLRGHAEETRKPGAVVVAGPGLRAAQAEAEAVVETWGDARMLAGEQATCAATVESLPTAGVVHLATHGRHETDNPLFSSLRLADGPLFAHELDGVDLRGAVVVLSACEAGLSSVRIGGEPLGLTSVLLRLGARAVIASVAPLRDDVAARTMPVFHGGLRAGALPGEALAAAVAHEDEPVPLVCFGPLVV